MRIRIIKLSVKRSIKRKRSIILIVDLFIYRN